MAKLIENIGYLRNIMIIDNIDFNENGFFLKLFKRIKISIFF